MENIITKNQKNRIIEKMVFKMLDNKNYYQLLIDDRIYFIKYIKDDWYVDIIYYKSSGWCLVYNQLILIFSLITSSNNIDIDIVISKWVENTLEMEVKKTRYWSAPFSVREI